MDNEICIFVRIHEHVNCELIIRYKCYEVTLTNYLCIISEQVRIKIETDVNDYKCNNIPWFILLFCVSERSVLKTVH